MDTEAGQRAAVGGEATQASDAEDADCGDAIDIFADTGGALAKLLGSGGEEVEKIRSELAAYQRRVAERHAKVAAAAAAKRRRAPAKPESAAHPHRPPWHPVRPP